MQTPRRHLGLHHLALRADNIAGLRHFYVDILGFEVEREIPDRELWLTSGTDSLVFLKGSPGTLDHFGLMVSSAEDVGFWERTLRSAGVAILEPTQTYDDDSVGMICRDPAGHALQLLWHPRASAALRMDRASA